MRQSRLNSGLDFQVKVFECFQVILSSVKSSGVPQRRRPGCSKCRLSNRRLTLLGNWIPGGCRIAASPLACPRERGRERAGEGGRERERESEREGERERERKRAREKERERERARDRKREKERAFFIGNLLFRVRVDIPFSGPASRPFAGSLESTFLRGRDEAASPHDTRA